jgi:hypothetical protein
VSTREKIFKARLRMLALAEELQNVSLVCQRAGISRSHCHEILVEVGVFPSALRAVWQRHGLILRL